MRFIIVLILILLIPGCSDQAQSQSQQRSLKKLSEPVYIKANVKSKEDAKVMVVGNTNLPDTTELIISISNDTVGFEDSCNSVVERGQFSSGLLGYDGGLKAGKYRVEIIMPIPSTQSDYVRRIIGASGEHLSGPLVSELAQEKLVEYSFPYTVGSSKQIELEENQHMQKVSKIKDEIVSLYKQGLAMDRYRYSEELSSFKTCGELMRRYQSQAKAVREKTETLPIKYHELTRASIELISCVSCSRDADEACARVSEALSKSENKNARR